MNKYDNLLKGKYPTLGSDVGPKNIVGLIFSKRKRQNNFMPNKIICEQWFNCSTSIIILFLSSFTYGVSANTHMCTLTYTCASNGTKEEIRYTDLSNR